MKEQKIVENEGLQQALLREEQEIIRNFIDRRRDRDAEFEEYAEYKNETKSNALRVSAAVGSATAIAMLRLMIPPSMLFGNSAQLKKATNTIGFFTFLSVADMVRREKETKDITNPQNTQVDEEKAGLHAERNERSLARRNALVTSQEGGHAALMRSGIDQDTTEGKAQSFTTPSKTPSTNEQHLAAALYPGVASVEPTGAFNSAWRNDVNRLTTSDADRRLLAEAQLWKRNTEALNGEDKAGHDDPEKIAQYKAALQRHENELRRSGGVGR